MEALKVLKFGGTSVGSPEALQQLKEIVTNAGKVAVVVSAFSGVTDQLIALGKRASAQDPQYRKDFLELEKRHLDMISGLLPEQEKKSVEADVRKTLRTLSDILHGVFLLKELSPRTLDLLCSFGERLSAFIIAHYLTSQGLPSEFCDARNLIVTDAHFTAARVDFSKTNDRIAAYFKTHVQLQVITGFIAATPEGEVTTLGRGGSDYTAAIVAAALDAQEIQIWKEVDGVMTADPKKVPGAILVKELTYQEAMELSHFGAKVIHPPTMRPAMQKGIPIRIKNTFAPEKEGSLIKKKAAKSEWPVRGITAINDVSLILLQGSGLQASPGITARLFSALANKEVNMILISQASSEHSICFAISPSEALVAKKAIEEEFRFEMRDCLIDPIMVQSGLSIIAIVGEAMKHSPGVSGKLFTALGSENVNVVAIAQGSSELNISVVIPKDDQVKALNAVHDVFFFKEKSEIRNAKFETNSKSEISMFQS